LSGEQSWLKVTQAALYLHQKRNDPLAPPSLRASYVCGLSSYDEYISFERNGWPRQLAEKWWFALSGKAPAPVTVAEAIERCDEIDRPVDIAVFRNDRWWNISDRRVIRADGTMVEIDRHFNCWVTNSRQAALEELRKEPINDEIVF
jgi:DNA repair protein RadD